MSEWTMFLFGKNGILGCDKQLFYKVRSLSLERSWIWIPRWFVQGSPLEYVGFQEEQDSISSLIFVQWEDNNDYWCGMYLGMYIYIHTVCYWKVSPKKIDQLQIFVAGERVLRQKMNEGSTVSIFYFWLRRIFIDTFVSHEMKNGKVIKRVFSPQILSTCTYISQGNTHTRICGYGSMNRGVHND